MQICQSIHCNRFPCEDVRHEGYYIPSIDIDPQKVMVVLISEATATDLGDNYYAPGTPSFAQTTLSAFRAAGMNVQTLEDILNRGFYLTTAVKCNKTGYAIQTATVKECSLLLEEELDLFPNVVAYLLMGDIAIQAFNAIARRKIGSRAIPPGSTYKIRGREYYYQGVRLFPSYLQVGPSYGIEKSKQRMIAEDIAAAIKLVE